MMRQLQAHGTTSHACMARVDRQQQWQNRKAGARNEVVAAKVAEFSAKEDATMASFRAMLGQQGGPITIKKRG